MIWFQKLLILILTPFAKLSDKIDSKFKKNARIVLLVMVCCLPYIWYTCTCVEIVINTLVKMIQAIVLIVIYLFFCLEQPLKEIKWNKLLMWLWFIFGMLIFVMGFVHKQNPGYWMSGPVFALGFPCVYFVVMQSDLYKEQIDNIAKIVLVISVIYFLITVATAEFISPDAWVSGRYNGIAFDCNRVGEFCIIEFCCACYCLSEKSKLWKALSIWAIGSNFGLAYVTQSRTTVMVLALVPIMYLIIAIKQKKKFQLKYLGVVLIIAAIAAAHIGCINFLHDKYKVVEKGEIELEFSERFGVNDNDASVDRYSSGRLQIWTNYASQITLTGNERTDENPIKGEKKVINAHNSTIEYAYRSGAVTGLVYILIQILLAWYVLKVMFVKCKGKEYAFVAAVVIGFGLFTNLMPSYYPITSAINFFFLMVQMPLLEKKGE